MLPSLANIFAYYDPDPETRRRVLAALHDTGGFDAVAEVLGGWVVAWRSLPDSRPFGGEFHGHQLAFAEGRDQLAGGDPAADAADDVWRRLVRCVDETPHKLDAFPGDFGFVRFRPHGSATVVRSCAGLVPLYWWQDGPRRAVTTQIANILKFTPYEMELDPLPNAIWAGIGYGIFPDNRTFFRGITIVPRGHFVRLDRDSGSPKAISYWDPRPDRLPKYSKQRAAEHAERLRDILLNKLETELHPERGNLLTLSGGVDSSSLAALSTQVLGKRIGTLSVVPAREDLLAHEMQYIRPLVEHPNVERSWYIHVDENTVLPQFSLPVAFHVPHPCLRKLPDIHQEWPVKVLFGGEWADELTGSKLSVPDWNRHMSLPGLLLASLRGRTPFGRKNFFRWMKHRLINCARRPFLPYAQHLSEIFAHGVREEYHEWRRGLVRNLAKDRRPLRFLDVHTRQPDGFIAMNWEACTSLNVRRSLPFVNREAFDLAFACNPIEMVGPNTKQLQRMAMKPLIPLRNLKRTDKGGWGRALAAVPRKSPPHRRIPDELARFLTSTPQRRLHDGGGNINGHVVANMLGFWATLGAYNKGGLF